MYDKILKRLREEADTPVEAVVPEKTGFVNKKQAGPSEEPVEYSPYSNMKDWMSIIRSSGMASRENSQNLMQSALSFPTVSPPSKRRQLAVEEGSGKNDKRRSAFDLDVGSVKPITDSKGNTPFGLQVGDETLSLIRQYEGMQESPYWDVNHWRVGYGSDTITGKDGKIRKTTKNDVISKEEAELDLARRVGLIEKDIQDKVGTSTWNNFSANTKAALTSVAYNYGTLPKNVVSAAKLGDNNTIAMAVENLASHNGGVNSKRRREEASLIRS